MQTILIVDDDSQGASFSEKALSGRGYNCRIAGDTASAYRLLNETAIDLLLCNVNLSDGSGLAMARDVRTTCPETAIIIVSTSDDPNLARDALEIGVHGYVVKPFTANALLINVDNTLRRTHLEQEKRVHLKQLEALVEQRTESLNDQRVFHQHIIDAIPTPIFYKDTNGCFQGCNAAFTALMGVARETIVGKTIDDILPLNQSAVFVDTDRRLRNSSGPLSYEATLIDQQNQPHRILFNKSVYHDLQGRTAGLVGVLMDITQRKAAEEALRLSEEKFRQIVEDIGTGVAVIGSRMEILWMNTQMAKWFPEARDDGTAICHRFFNTPALETPCNRCPAMQAMREGKRVESISTTTIHARQRHLRRVASPIHDVNDRVTAAIMLVEDITDKIIQEREMQQARKLEAIGQLAAGIAHEINTPIQYVGDNVAFLEDAFTDLRAALTTYGELLAAAKADAVNASIIAEAEAAIEQADLSYLADEIPNAIEQTLEGIQRVSQIVTAMRQFSHPGSDRKSPVELNKALETTITVARNAWKYVADIETDFNPHLPMVNCLPGEINQVFLNLLINAAHAIGEVTQGGKTGKGRIRISTRQTGDTVEIRFSDTGGGIPKAIQDRVFDPFFTTKPVGTGTGQGLAIAHSVIADKHQGTIYFESTEGQGTTFVIALPLEVVADQGEAQ
ncbi:hypothetical protein JCM12296A_07510 [Desulfosarcina cetonica]|uniref:ATP-binding protein n=1 Tax=Desulfosarcina cetonica TaxID=90730 RepID=UPI0006D288AC|nr:ATP-binding protein [Desulfosarcina cetonica]